jgi:hypothetical protein
MASLMTALSTHILAETVTLRKALKSSEFGAILWLISRHCDNEQTYRPAGREREIPLAMSL